MTGSPFSPQTLAKYSAPTPKAPATSVAHPLLMLFDSVPPKIIRIKWEFFLEKLI